MMRQETVKYAMDDDDDDDDTSQSVMTSLIFTCYSVINPRYED
jgi:hypothetical protein